MKKLEDCRALVSRMLSLRAAREARWRELSRWICPSRGLFANRREDSPDTLATLRFTQAASQACLNGASGLTTGMTPRNAAWFKSAFRQAQLLELPGARQWLDSIDELVRNCLASGGFYQAIHSFNMDLIWAGCALLFAEETGAGDNDLGALRYECPQVGTWCVSRDSYGNLNRVARRLVWSVGDLAEIFGEDKLCRASRGALEKKPLDARHVWHLTLAEENGIHKVSSYWWEEGGDDFLRVGGYREMPFFYTCWHEGATVYGTGPGDEALPDARQMDLLERNKLEGLAKIVNPPVSAPMQLKGHCRLEAGAINYGPERTLITPILDLSPFASSLPHLREEISVVGQRLERSLLSSIFTSMPLSVRPAGMSATEFLERKREALQQLGPVISAYEPHVLTPLLFRTVQTLDYYGATTPPPEELARYPLELTLDFISPMANALRQSSAETARALFGEVANILAASQDRSVMDKLDLDQLVDELATGLGSPGAVIRSDMEVEQIRQQRQQSEAMMQEMQARMMQAQGAQAEADAYGAQAKAAMQMQVAGAGEETDGINLLTGME